MSAATRNIFIVGAKRTPFGAFGGKLKSQTATDLATHASKAAIAQVSVMSYHVMSKVYSSAKHVHAIAGFGSCR